MFGRQRGRPGHVDDEEDLALEGRQVDRLALGVLHREVVDTLREGTTEGLYGKNTK